VTSGRSARVPRSVGITGVWVCAIAAGLIVVALGVDIVGRTLPTGSRTSVGGVGPSDQQSDVGPFWYTREQAEALSTELAAAVDGTTWCVGWSIVLAGEVPVEDYAYVVPYETGIEGGGTSFGFGEHADVGSNRGPGRSARSCSEWAEVEVVYEYTSSTSPLEDNAGFAVRASDPVVEEALRVHPALQMSSDTLLHEDRGENTDDVIGNTIAALPLALAEQGRIDPLSVEPVAAGTEGSVTFEDSEGEGGSDLLIANRTSLLVGALVVLAGLLLLCMAWGQVPARWFAPMPGGSAWPTTAPPGAPGVPQRAAGRPGNPRRTLKHQLERARVRASVGEQGGPP